MPEQNKTHMMNDQTRDLADEPPDDLLQARQSLQNELDTAEAGINKRVGEVSQHIQQARKSVTEHCDRVEQALEKRRFLLLQEVDRLELQRVRVLEKQKKQLRKIRRYIGDDVQTEETRAKVEKYLSVQSEFERSSCSSSPSSSSTTSSSSLRDDSARPGVGSAKGDDYPVHEDPVLGISASKSSRRNSSSLGSVTTPAGAEDHSSSSASSSGSSTEYASDHLTWAGQKSLLADLRRRVITTPCADSEVYLDLKEAQLVPLLERLGTVSATPELVAGQHFFLPTDLERSDTMVAIMPREVKQMTTMLGGCLAGITSATLTHWLDVAKVLRQVGARAPPTASTYLLGIGMGAFAQGQRFGLTLVIDQNMQRELKKHSDNRIVSFCGSMVAAGSGEFLAMPPVVVKNYQIAHLESSPFVATRKLYAMDGFRSFFRGVFAGVVRKSLANAIVLQSIGPTKLLLSPLFSRNESTTSTKTSSSASSGSSSSSSSSPSTSTPPKSMLQKMGVGFLAGSITGSFAEVATNYPDRVKTLMHTKRVTLYNAALEAARDPFRGALWAGLRKGVIRGINWGSVGIFTTLLEDMYWKWQTPATASQYAASSPPSLNRGPTVTIPSRA
ncbi:unnamed protein product [Amoebophrya sp. A25]|nr:unnamed protein product [Amoebophrya sp. A25]|eukprot:GSA25T00026360001.1